MLSQICFKLLLQKKCFTNDGFDLLKSSKHALKRLAWCALVKNAYCGSNCLIEKRCLDKYSIKTICIKHKEKTKVKLEIFTKRKSVKSRKECVFC